jgi:superfamily I DNA/RNA helicase
MELMAENARLKTELSEWKQELLESTDPRYWYHKRKEAEARIAALEAERDALRSWLDNNMTHYNTAEAGARPILAEFGKRVWYHVTDDTESFPFSAAIDAAKEKP